MAPWLWRMEDSAQVFLPVEERREDSSWGATVYCQIRDLLLK